MQDEIKVCLEDIEKAISEIKEFLPQPRNYFEFEKDLKTKRAVERNIEIIGETMGRILKVEPGIEISASRKIVDTRNRIIHGYDSVSDDLKTKSTLAALKMALKNRKYPKRKLIHHSDRGFQYTSEDYTNKLKKEKIKISMTTKYDPYENAIAERVNGILKDEFEISNRKLSIPEVKRNVNYAIKIYIHKRPHWSCKFLTPEQAHKKEKFKLKNWSKFKFSKN